MNEMAEKKIEENKSENRGKYTELELRTRGIGKFHDNPPPLIDAY